jgi:hypothetical protein
MFGYDHWTNNSVQMHVVLDSPIALRSLLVPGLRYPFVDANKAVAIGLIPSSHGKSIRLAQHVGFMCAHRIRDGWADGDDLVLLEMRRENCRFLKERWN